MSSIRVAADIKVYFNDVSEAFRSPQKFQCIIKHNNKEMQQAVDQDSVRVMMHRCHWDLEGLSVSAEWK